MSAPDCNYCGEVHTPAEQAECDRVRKAQAAEDAVMAEGDERKRHARGLTCADRRDRDDVLWEDA